MCTKLNTNKPASFLAAKVFLQFLAKKALHKAFLLVTAEYLR